jgi:predicted ArsR family transcriptional regulator
LKPRFNNPDLFAFRENSYPRSPGFRDRDTSREAARAIAPLARTQRGRVLAALQRAYPNGLSSDEIAKHAGVNKYAVRSRVAELQAIDPPQVEATDARTKNETGMTAKIWRATPASFDHVGNRENRHVG